MARYRVRRGLESARSGVTPPAGELIFTTDQQKLYAGDGSTAGGVPVKATFTLRLPYTWAIAGALATGASLSMFISLPTGQTGKIVAARYKIGSGTSATISVEKNGSGVTGLTGLSATTTTATTDPTDVALADNDELRINITGISGSPADLSFTLFVELTL